MPAGMLSEHLFPCHVQLVFQVDIAGKLPRYLTTQKGRKPPAAPQIT